MGIESPIRDGMVVNWDMLEKLWEHSLTKYCGRNDLKDTPVLLAEKPYAPVAARHRYETRCSLPFLTLKLSVTFFPFFCSCVLSMQNVRDHV